MEMQPILPTTPLSVTLTAQEWNEVVDVLMTAPVPYRIVHPLMVKLGGQLQRNAETPAIASSEES